MFGRKKGAKSSGSDKDKTKNSRQKKDAAAAQASDAAAPPVAPAGARGPNSASATRLGVNPAAVSKTDTSQGSNQAQQQNNNNRRHEPSVTSTAYSVSKSIERMRIHDPKDPGGDSDGNRRKHGISYAAERVIGNGSFGVVYQATVIETGETVAIKKVLQDRRFKNRELQIMRTLEHPCVIRLKNSFLAKGDKPDEVYLNLVMEFVPETIYRTLRNHTKAKKLVPIMYTRVYMFQVCRAIAYIHSLGICHRDIKPQNLLLEPTTHVVKLCDFGSAKVLQKGQPNVSYICSRYYRAPELVFEATEYTTAIDIWSLGCVLAELLLGKPLFPGDSGVDQLIEIIKILGTPTREEIFAMNPNHTTFSFPQITPHPWHKVFRSKCPKQAIDLVSRFLVYKPQDRLDPFDALAHPFFDELRQPDVRLPNGKQIPPLFNFTPSEIEMARRRGLVEKVFPEHIRASAGFAMPPSSSAAALPSAGAASSASSVPAVPEESK